MSCERPSPKATARTGCPGLPPGRYDLTAELGGFANAEVSDITITIGLEVQRDLTMALQTLQETVYGHGGSAGRRDDADGSGGRGDAGTD